MCSQKLLLPNVQSLSGQHQAFPAGQQLMELEACSGHSVGCKQSRKRQLFLMKCEKSGRTFQSGHVTASKGLQDLGIFEGLATLPQQNGQ